MKTDIWTEQKIKVGFQRFFEEHGRLPRSHEIDNSTYLPSSRLIQKKYGGLEKLRTKLGFLDAHFGKGKHRSTIAHTVNSKGSDYERSLEKILQDKFGEVFVHSEKMLGVSKVRVDFYIYCPNGNFAVDIFHSDTMRTLQSNVNIKQKKYKNYDMPIYLISANRTIAQSSLDAYVQQKKNAFQKNVTLVGWDTFLSMIKSKKVYKSPVTSSY